MSASMAEVVKRHVALEDTWDFVPEGKILCNWVECGFEIDADEDDNWRDTFANHVAERLAANGYGKLEDATRLIRDLTDPDDCTFDHHGGCQAHGYLSLEPGEMCPQLEAKVWARNHRRPE